MATNNTNKLHVVMEEPKLLEREEINQRKREEDRLTQIWLQEYEIEARKAKEADEYWAAWRKKHNLFAPTSKK
jgi:hypothetical protein